MATATQDAPIGTVDNYTNGFMPDFFAKWEAEKAQRAQERAAKRPLTMECLDAETAKEYEAKKPKFEFQVECTYRLPDDRGRLQTKTDKMTVRAQSENEAWALFCDRIEHWPARNSVDVTITKTSKQAR